MAKLGQASEHEHEEIGEETDEPSGRPREDIVGACRQDEERDRERDDAAEGDLAHPVDGEEDRADGSPGRAEEHDHRRHRRDAETRIDRGENRKRQERHGEPGRQRVGIAVRHDKRHDAAEHAATDRADEALDRRLERSADARLHDDDGGEHRPVALGEAEHLREGIGRNRGNRHPHRQPQLGPAPNEPGAEVGPGGGKGEGHGASVRRSKGDGQSRPLRLQRTPRLKERNALDA